MIYLHFIRRNVKKEDKQKYEKIIAKAIPVLIQRNKVIFSLSRNIGIEIKLILK